jgi:hypothetical protein
VNSLNLEKFNTIVKLSQSLTYILSLQLASGADPDNWGPVSQIQESQIVEDPGVMGSKIAVLAFTLSLERTLNLFKMTSSAPSWTIAARAQLYTQEYCATLSEIFRMADRERVRMALDGAKCITCEY